ncbi:MAG TPA: zinc-binding dehydrogenase [Vicinamibacterales bacterium]|nr:zinc-binding dehydrogenase [Vicinamibacterales bacterium]
MPADSARTGLQLRSLARANGQLELSLVSVAVPDPAPDEVVVRIEASPLNPSDLGLLFGAADMATATYSGTAAHPVVTATIPPARMRAVAARLDQSMPVGNEGAGVVVATGAADEARALLGKTVAIIGGAMYAQYRSIKADQCLVLPEGTTAAEGASCFVNPLTALGMVETMRREGHTALVHTAAASNLGHMLIRICQADGIGLVNVVRSQAHEEALRAVGAEHVCISTSPAFTEQLTASLLATGATLAFDAVGGGPLAGQILTSMETVANRNASAHTRYGSSTHKQVYVYGRLDSRPIELGGAFGMAWSVGGWLLFPFLTRIGAAAAQSLRERVVRELKTTFASHYARSVSLAEALQPDAIAAYGRRATGEKYLITPQKGLAG